ncbi:hypothetical protein B0H14DRAFT_3635718 [Mycena olivaceomarginata]|nr:hypothetical protein B0H14DRAFT_3635718 [Mycena olivaceomarginata]
MALPTGVYLLPVELLSRVFVLGAADQVLDSPFLLRPDEDHCVGSVTDFQLLVSHVCKHWREVALRMSCLWTSLHFREPAHIPRAEAFLARAAANHTLDILVDTVSVDDHIPGVTLCRDEMREIFALIIPHVVRWRAFHLKVRANECKLIARQALSTCGPAPRLETLQLYHFEDYRTTQNLYIATYRPPVVIFDNVLPALKNVSLIGLGRHIAPLPAPRRLRLHYSGPRAADEHSERICVPDLEELSLTDLDPDHLTRLLHTLELPRLTLSRSISPSRILLQCPEQDFTGVVQMIAGVLPSTVAPAAPLPIAALHTLRIIALRMRAGRARGAPPRPRVPAICGVLLETITLPLANADAEETRTMCECEDRRRAPVLPRLEEARLFGLAGERVRGLMAFRAGFAEGCGGGSGCPAECAESPPSSACSSSSFSAPGSPEDSTPTSSSIIIGSEVDFSPSRCGRAAKMPRFVVRWSARRRARDAVLEQLVRQGRVECVDEDDGEDDDVNEGLRFQRSVRTN